MMPLRMRVLFVADKDARTPLSQDLRSKVMSVIGEKGNDIEILEIGSDDVVPCLGCLLCVLRVAERHGLCVSTDTVAEFNSRIGDFDLVCFFGPVIFGQFSSTMKSVVEKTQTNRMLRSRFVIAIGYGDDIRDEELETFFDIYRKHLGKADVLHTLFPARVEVFASRSLEETDALCAQLERVL